MNSLVDRLPNLPPRSPIPIPSRRRVLLALPFALGLIGSAWLAGGTLAAAAEPTPALKDLDGHFPFSVPASAEDWAARADAVRLQTRIALGVHPLPELAAPVATIHGRREMDGYTIEKVILESLPGHFVTASLYRPFPAGETDQRRPAVMYAHGHWNDGRFYETPAGDVPRLLASGGERFENAAINHMQAACVQLARMGVIALQYDMIGYADSQQISFDRAHRYGINDSNPAVTDAGWPLFSTLAEGYGQSVMGLQTINTLQAFEMLRNLPDVDPAKIAITGASGGGTQSFIATAVDTRFAGSLPAVMVSTRMQGGCTCENACGLRVATGNIELAALTAPRPLGMTTANDWTVGMPEDGFPELKRLYALVGKPDAVQLFPGAHFPHNYNHVARVAMYGWVNQLFGLGLKEPILERDFELVRKDQLTVWDASHPQPASGIDYERELTRTWAEQIDAATRPAAGDSPEVLKQKRDLVAEGWRSLTAWSEGYRGMAQGNAQWSGNSGRGPVIAVRLTAVPSVGQSPQFALSVRDPLAGELTDLAPLVKNPRPAAAYTYGYNAPPVIRRVGVLLDALSEQRGDRDVKYKLIVGDDQILLAAAAALQWPEGIASIEWATEAHADFDPLWQVESIRDPRFIPSALRFQGLPGLLATLGDRVNRVAAPRP